MAKSRKNKDRQDKLNSFKEGAKHAQGIIEKLKQKQQETMANVPEQKPFRQVPTWESDATFEIKGYELEALYNFFNIFTGAFQSIQQVFARGVQAGNIKIGYEYEDGTPVADDEVNAYTQKLNEYFKQRQEEETNKLVKDPAPKSKIVSFTGEPVESETAVD